MSGAIIPQMPKSSIEKLGIACDRDDFAYTQAIRKAPSTKDLWASQITQSDVTMNYLATLVP